VENGDTVEEQQGNAWIVFNALCQKAGWTTSRLLQLAESWGRLCIPPIVYYIVRSQFSAANVSHLHTAEEINRDPVILDDIRPKKAALASSLPIGTESPSHNIQEEEIGVPPRREYVWRTMDGGQQSLATVARTVAVDLDMNLSSLRRTTRTHGQNPHRCAGYVREEITLATSTLDSAVVAHDAPSPSELCSVCHEVVGPHEIFRCVCGDHGQSYDLVVQHLTNVAL
jgi:hypothetical protein